MQFRKTNPLEERQRVNAKVILQRSIGLLSMHTCSINGFDVYCFPFHMECRKNTLIKLYELLGEFQSHSLSQQTKGTTV